MKYLRITAAAVFVLTAATACSDDKQPPAASATSPSSATTPASSLFAPTAVPTLPTNGTPEDTLVCGSPNGLEGKGDGFYKTFEQLMMGGGSLTIKPLVLAQQLRTLSTIGAPDGGANGSAAIDAASPPVRKALNDLVREASTLAEVYTGIARGQQQEGHELDQMPNLYTMALIECTKAGIRPSYFYPNEVTGH